MTDRADDTVQDRSVAVTPRSAFAPYGNAMRRSLARVLPGACFCVVTVAAWQIMSWRVANPLVPGVGEIGDEIVRITAKGLAAQQIAITLGRVLLGFGAAFAAAFAVLAFTLAALALSRAAFR